MSFENQKNEIINTAEKLLTEGRVKAVLAFTESEMEGKAVPHFFRNAHEIEKIKWDGKCTPNLAKYLIEKKEKLAVLAKPCDSRAIVMYIVEKQIKRDDVYIIGVECQGMTDKEGKTAPGCRECKVKIPPVYDVLVNNPDAKIENSYDECNNETRENIEQNLERFQKEMNKCILCYTCRQACYGCYCKTCFMDRNIPNWLPSEIDIGSKMTFHLGRAMHLAGRCVECGACERVCPSGVNIRYLIKELTDLCKELYGYSAGMDIEETPAIAAFNIKDREVGFMGGDDNESCCHT